MQTGLGVKIYCFVVAAFCGDGLGTVTVLRRIVVWGFDDGRCIVLVVDSYEELSSGPV